MMRMTYGIGLVIVLAAGLLSLNVAVGKTPAATDEQWDNAGPAKNSVGEVAMGPEDGPPDGMPVIGAAPMGPPPDRDAAQWPPRHGKQEGRDYPPKDGRGPGMGGPMGGMGMKMGMQGPGPMPGPGGPAGMGLDLPGGPNGPMGPMCMMPNDPEMRELLIKDGQLERDSFRLAGQYRHATTEAREKIEKEIEETVTKQFEVRQQRRNLELKHLEEQLKDLREAVDKREKARKELIEKRVSRLLGTEKDLDF